MIELVCPCGLGDGLGSYQSCCGRLHSGQMYARTAEELMRSRYSAFAVGDAAYLTRTWHSSTRPTELSLDRSISWTRLRVLATAAGETDDVAGTVEFRAHYRSSDLAGGAMQRGAVHEVSRFVREKGNWVYLDGSQRPDANACS